MLVEVALPFSDHAFKMADCTFLKVIKHLIYFALLAMFLFMTLRALVDLYSYRTTLIISKRPGDITTLPPFSVCENFMEESLGFNKTQLADGMMKSGLAKTFSVDFQLTFGIGLEVVRVNLSEEAEIRKYLQYEKIEDLWTLQCKPFIFYTNKAYCMPCMTFKGASFKNEEIGLIGSIMVMAVTMKPSTKTDWGFEGVIQLHDKQQSLLLETDFDWNQGSTFKFKNKTL